MPTITLFCDGFAFGKWSCRLSNAPKNLFQSAWWVSGVIASLTNCIVNAEQTIYVDAIPENGQGASVYRFVANTAEVPELNTAINLLKNGTCNSTSINKISDNFVDVHTWPPVNRVIPFNVATLSRGRNNSAVSGFENCFIEIVDNAIAEFYKHKDSPTREAIGYALGGVVVLIGLLVIGMIIYAKVAGQLENDSYEERTRLTNKK